jgi:hypothetical protein
VTDIHGREGENLIIFFSFLRHLIGRVWKSSSKRIFLFFEREWHDGDIKGSLEESFSYIDLMSF